MPELTVEFEVYCSCGNGLCGQTTDGGENKWGSYITVEPCEKCLDQKYDEGHEDGYEEGSESK